jgi:hypothetical protein
VIYSVVEQILYPTIMQKKKKVKKIRTQNGKNKRGYDGEEE